jgi:anti-sigma B factor antagonist
VQSEFRVDVRTERGATVIAVSGELDLASSPILEERLEQVFGSDSTSVILDLRRLDFMDSTGLSVLIKAHQSAEEASQRLYLVKGPPQVQRLLNLTGVGERLSVLEAPEDALGGG